MEVALLSQLSSLLLLRFPPTPFPPPRFSLLSFYNLRPSSLCARARALSLSLFVLRFRFRFRSRVRVRVWKGSMRGRRGCELCKGRAAVYCEADAAFLCWSCDARVHGANFLVARHLRRIACAECHALDEARVLAGARSSPVRSLCRSCRPREKATSSGSSDSSSCVSTADSESARRGRAEGVMVEWGRRVGLGDRGSRRCAATATRVLRACARKMTAMPLRVCLAAALWFAVKRCGACEGAMLRALEACSRVPAKLIVVAESRLARAARRARVGEEREEWAECW